MNAEISGTELIAFAGLAILVATLFLLRRRHIRAEYSFGWLTVGAILSVSALVGKGLSGWLGITLDMFCLCLAAILLLRRVWRRFGWGYTAYAVVVLVIPILGTKDFMGTGRYVLVAFPVLAAAGDYLATSSVRWLRPVSLVVCGLLLIVMTVLYSRGIEVS